MSIADAVKLVHGAPAALSRTESLFLYSSVLSFRPTTCLEIGACKGGSTMIIALALDWLGKGHLFSIDPHHQISGDDFQKIAHRATLVHGRSPAAVKNLGDQDHRFDFVFVDGDHGHASVRADCQGIYPYLNSEALVLFHDAYNRGVRTAIDRWIKEHPSQLLDHGLVDKSLNSRYRPPHLFGGLRAVTYQGKA